MNNKFDAVVAGHICLDIIPIFENVIKSDMNGLLTPGKVINMGKVNISTGGPVSNTGIALERLGIKTSLMGKIGNDYFGKGILEILGNSACRGMNITEGQQTSYTVVIVPPGVDRIFLHSPGANNTFASEDINYDLVEQSRIFHFGYPPLMEKIFEDNAAQLIKIFKKVKDLGVTTSLDMSLPDPSSRAGKVDWEKVLQNLLPYVDIYIPSVEETLFMIARDEYRKLYDTKNNCDILESLDIDVLPLLGAKLINYGAKIAVIKCGVKGYYVKTQSRQALANMGKAKPADLENWADRELMEESFHVPNIASATGSGDSSIAGFLAAFLKGKQIEESIRFACAVGGLNLTCFDAISGIRSWEETHKLIEKGWEKNSYKIKSTKWKYDTEKKNWFLNKKD